MATNGIPDDNQNLTTGIHSIAKNSLAKSSIAKSSSSEKDDSCVDGFFQNTRSDSCVDGFDKVIDFYNNNIGLITPYSSDLLKDYAKEMSSEVVVYALKLSVESNSRNLKYIKAILNNWSKAGVKNLIEAQQENSSHKTHNQTTEETEEEKIARKTKALEEAMKNANK